ncbi:MAG: class I SAM-dependent methyltransferase [Deltaproteobacteria bacterium]|nr:class I SAM-dependent methyltransferase [Deltaproteobacteria bacterium]
MKCRMCKGSGLDRFLDLGFTPPADQFLTAAQLRQSETAYPLDVYLCRDCGLAQLGTVVPPEILYQNDYPYESSTTKTGREHWAALARQVVGTLDLKPGSLAVDVGSNVGVLLSAFRDEGMRVCGVDPAPNIVAIANGRGIETICDFFSDQSAAAIVKAHGPASVVTGTNVFAHVDDLDAFVRSLQVLLADDGVFVFEAPHFAELVKQLEYDTIYHEHLSYLAVRPLIPFFKKHGMEVFDVTCSEIHGGSICVFAGKAQARPVHERVGRALAEEEALGLGSTAVLQRFAADVAAQRMELMWLLHSLKREGKKIVGVSAPAKGMTLLNYCRIGPELLDFVTEKSTLKIGRYTPGTHIPVVPDAMLLQAKPDYALLLAWNFAEEIMKNLDGFRAQGGKFIIPVPRPRIVG